MKDTSKTKAQLIAELEELRRKFNQVDSPAECQEFDESQSSLYKLFDMLNDMFFVLDYNGTIIKVNDVVVDRLGYTNEELIGESVLKVHPKERHSEAIEIIGDVLAGKGELCRIPLFKGDGSELPVETRITLGIWKNQPVVFGVSRDISEQIEADKRLRVLALAVEQSINGILVADLEGVIQYANTSWAEMHGYQVEQLSGKTLHSFHTKEQLENEVAPFHENVRQNGAHEGEVGHIKVDGTIFPTWMATSLLKDSHGKEIGFVGIAIDITKQKQAEFQLAKEKNIADSLINNIPGFFYLFTQEGKYLRWNDSLETTMEYSSEEISQRHPLEMFIDSEKEKVAAKIQEVLENGIAEVETVVLTKSGKSLPYYFNGVRVEIDDMPCILGIGTPLKQLKKTEAALKESEEKYHGIFDESVVTIYIFNSEKSFVDSNQAGLNLLGYSREEILQMNIADVDYNPEAVKPAHKHLGEGGALENYEHRLIAKDGRIIWVLNNSIPLTDIQGNATGILSTLIDITERKEAESLLELQRKLGFELMAAGSLNAVLSICLEMAISASSLDAGGIYLVDKKDGVNLICHHGLAQDFIEEVSHYDYDPDMPNIQMIAAGRHVYFDREDLCGDYKEMLPDADVKSIAIIPIKYENEVIACFNVLSYASDDIPEFARAILSTIATQVGAAISRAKVESALRTSESHLALALEASEAGYYDQTADFSHFSVNERWCDILGYSLDKIPAEARARARTLAELFHPDDLETCKTSFGNFIECRTDKFRAEFRLRHADGSWRWISSMATCVERDSHGKVHRLIGVAFDVTQRKEAEKDLRQAHSELELRVSERTRELQASEARWLSLVENAPDSIITCDKFGKVLSINRAYFGFAVEKVIGNSIYSFVDPEVQQEMRQLIEKVYKTGSPDSYEFSGVGQSQNTTWYSTRISPVIEDGKVTAVTLISNDVSQQKAIQEALKESEELFRNLSDNSPNMIFINDFENIVYANIECEDVMGYKRDELYAKDFHFMSLVASDSQESLLENYNLGTQGIEVPPQDYVVITKEGRRIDVLLASKLISFQGKPSVLGILVDITERKKVEAQLKASLEEKEALLKEIHHRVKNNLQVIASLLNMQSRYMVNESAKDQIHESRDRVYSMALVHENLYQSENLAQINIASYINDLCNNILQSYGIDSRKIKLSINAQAVLLHIDQAVPCGLIINELLSNALKHAFYDNGIENRLRTNEVVIEIQRLEDDNLLLTIADNGNGLPDEWDIDSNKTLGLRLVKSLLKQLNASMEIENDEWTIFKISFARLSTSRN
jgi:PAS domain S-box-containing protein